MKINKKYIHNVSNYLGLIEAGAAFRVTLEIDESNKDRVLQQIGFSVHVESASTVLPSSIGPVSRFNAEGKWVPLRDEPKESRFIRTVKWRWKQWAGKNDYEEMEDERDIYRDCYVRDFIEPPSVELTYVEREGHHLIISPILIKEPAYDEKIRHVINLFLELFGGCELLHKNLSPFIAIETQRVNWQMLPEGEYPWPRVEGHLRGTLKPRSQDMQEMILDRQKTICEQGAKKCYVGLGGFSDYIAYLSESKKLVVLESIRKDNAIYVFGKNWKDFSKLSKAEVLSNNYHQCRIIHVKGWKEKLKEFLAIPEPAEA